MRKEFLLLLSMLFCASADAEDFYIKTGGGLFSRSFDSNVGYSGSAAIGVNAFGNFSFFISGEFNQYQVKPYGVINFSQTFQDWAFMGNLQYEYPLSELFKPYLFGGLGKDFTSFGQYTQLTTGAPLNQHSTAYQVGLGSDEKISKGIYIFEEAKWHYLGGPNFFQLQAGLKFGL